VVPVTIINMIIIKEYREQMGQYVAVFRLSLSFDIYNADFVSISSLL